MPRHTVILTSLFVLFACHDVEPLRMRSTGADPTWSGDQAPEFPAPMQESEGGDGTTDPASPPDPTDDASDATASTSPPTSDDGATTSVLCGLSACSVSEIVERRGGEACCVDAASGTCGARAAGRPCIPSSEAGTTDARCTPESGSLALGFLVDQRHFTGCCIDAMCGVRFDSLQLGCVEFSRLKDLDGVSNLEDLLALPQPRRCDDADAAVDDDADAAVDDDAGV